MYFRWVYSPESGDVTLSHNHEGHPADIRFHDELANERSEHELIYGYAHRIPAGWDITDEEHKEVSDPHILQQIQEAIGKAAPDRAE